MGKTMDMVHGKVECLSVPRESVPGSPVSAIEVQLEFLGRFWGSQVRMLIQKGSFNA